MSETPEETPVRNLGNHAALWFASDKSVNFKPWTGREDRALSKYLHTKRRAMSGGRIGMKISLTLAYMCTSFAGLEFWHEKDGAWVESCSETERLAHLRKMWETDIVTAYLLLRINEIEKSDLKLPLISPYDDEGKRECLWHGDLNDLPFVGSPDPVSQRWEYKLKRPARVRGKTVTKVVMGPMRWRVTESLKLQTAPHEAKFHGIAGSIHLIPEVSDNAELFYTQEDLDGFRKGDIEAMVQSIEANHSGLDLEIEVEDEVEDRTFKTSVPWLDSNFFADSSESEM